MQSASRDPEIEDGVSYTVDVGTPFIARRGDETGDI
jgi:hypothetical protein